MSYDYSENILVQESAGHLLERELGWEVAFAYNTEQLGKDGTFGRISYREILLTRYFRQALQRLNPWLTSAQLDEAQKKMESRLSTASSSWAEVSHEFRRWRTCRKYRVSRISW